MNAELEPRQPPGIGIPEIADRYEQEYLADIESVQDPDVAQQLLAEVKVAEEAVRLKKLGEDREKRWRAVVLKAERRYGELLGPPTHAAGPGRGNKTSGSVPLVSQADRDAAKHARKVAAVPQEEFEEYVNNTDNPSRAGLLKAPRKSKPPGNPKSSGHAKSKRTALEVDRINDPDVGRAADYVARRIAEEVPPKVLRGVVQNLASAVPAGGKPKNWNGKSNQQRVRDLNAQKRQGTYTDLTRLQAEINKACVILEDYDIRDYALDGSAEAALMSADSIYEDLISLGWWLDRALVAFSAWMEDYDVREKIAKLRDTSGRTPEEAETAKRLADRLERKLAARLEAADSNGRE